MIPPEVHEELGGWLATRPEHIAALAVSRRDDALHFPEFGEWPADERHAFIYYVQLLSFRKSLYTLAQYAAERELGRRLTDRESLTLSAVS